MRPARAVASFDSASAMVRVLSQHLRGHSSPALGMGRSAANVARSLLPLVNLTPPAVRERVYARSGQAEAVRQDDVAAIDAERIAQWVTEHYPRRPYPAVMVGSSSGAVTHLAALAGVPWLPQTLLTPVRHGGLDPDRPDHGCARMAPARDAFTEANPRIAVHHMHDANQDRLMIQKMAYFRFKYRTVPAAYRAFLEDCLPPGGTVLVIDCAESWPTTITGSRQVFQHGAVGGATAEEYHQGGRRVADFLTEQGSSHQAWETPAAETVSPEAEWGFHPAIVDDLVRLCERHDWRLERLRFPHPDSPSGPVAEIYRHWYQEQGHPVGHLLVDCFALMDAHLPLRCGFVPYWATFPTHPALKTLLTYMDRVTAYDEVALGLFSHGTRSIGLAPIAEWDKVLRRARQLGGYRGVDRRIFPQDFASNVRFHDELIRDRLPNPVPHPAPWKWIHTELACSRWHGWELFTGKQAETPA